MDKEPENLVIVGFVLLLIIALICATVVGVTALLTDNWQIN